MIRVVLGVGLALAILGAALEASARGHSYGGGYRSHSYGGSSHRGGSYRNLRAGNRYGAHK